jgi:hypothetical protein
MALKQPEIILCTESIFFKIKFLSHINKIILLFKERIYLISLFDMWKYLKFVFTFYILLVFWLPFCAQKSIKKVINDYCGVCY